VNVTDRSLHCSFWKYFLVLGMNFYPYQSSNTMSWLFSPDGECITIFKIAKDNLSMYKTQRPWGVETSRTPVWSLKPGKGLMERWPPKYSYVYLYLVIKSHHLV
jgi:hypothetical protein